MFEKLQIFQMAMGLVKHATASQAVVARNIANADTPGYRANELAPFSEVFQSGNQTIDLRTSRLGHIKYIVGENAPYRVFETNDPQSPNGNSVSLESEMVKASELRNQYDLALSVYSSSLNILRTSLGRR